MTTHRVEDFARQFPENGLKLLLQQPLNVRDLLRIARYQHTNAIDFDRLQLDPTTYVQRDYRHLESDVVLRGPLRSGRQTLLIYLLIEHQSEPDRLMPFRVLEYTLSIYRGQLREWGQTHTSLSDFVFSLSSEKYYPEEWSVGGSRSVALFTPKGWHSPAPGNARGPGGRRTPPP